VLDLAKAAVQRIGIGRGISMDIRSDAPPGSGEAGNSTHPLAHGNHDIKALRRPATASSPADGASGLELF
jgi:hypothetical protein